MQIGPPKRTITVEPIEDPVPREAPAPEEAPPPPAPEREPLRAP
jgi:hypothetical protein